mmetsp:Transcript_92845/g.262192  ORF Transcript_92845/g.262192 Transcript_92845/m.262192 type:complete len:281 (+) Transcript_92845:179-1021(+)
MDNKWSRHARTSSMRALSSSTLQVKGGSSMSSDSRKPKCVARRGNSTRTRRARLEPGAKILRATGRSVDPTADTSKLPNRSSTPISASSRPKHSLDVRAGAMPGSFRQQRTCSTTAQSTSSTIARRSAVSDSISGEGDVPCSLRRCSLALTSVRRRCAPMAASPPFGDRGGADKDRDGPDVSQRGLPSSRPWALRRMSANKACAEATSPGSNALARAASSSPHRGLARSAHRCCCAATLLTTCVGGVGGLGGKRGHASKSKYACCSACDLTVGVAGGVGS